MSDVFLGETVAVNGIVTGNNTSAGVAVVTIPSGSLPAGLYKVDVVDVVTAAASPALVNNLELRVGATPRRKIYHFSAVQNSLAAPYGSPQSMNLRVDGTQAISVNFTANFGAAETQTHDILLMATKLRD